jgi:ABC-type phosphate transport system substrate-binding protein
MKKSRTALRVGLAATVALGAVAATQLTAGADPAPSATDIVGVGSDVIQNSLDFIADGYGGLPGYNTAGNVNRIDNFDATSDANTRNAFTDPGFANGVITNITPLNPTVVLRAGTSPVTRPNGGGVGINALLYDGSTNQFAVDSTGNPTSTPAADWGPNDVKRIDYSRSPNLVTDANQTTARTNLGTKLHTVKFATDQQVIATASTTHAPAHLSDAQLVNIYEGKWRDWRQVPGAPDADPNWYYTDLGPSGQSISAETSAADNFALSNVTFTTGSAEPIYAEAPQDGAGVLTIFLNELHTADTSGIASGLKSWPTSSSSLLAESADPSAAEKIHPVQQNDPNAITGLAPSVAINAIVPFPKSRWNLVNSGYFLTPSSNSVLSAPYYDVNGTKDAGFHNPLSSVPVGSPTGTESSWSATKHFGISLLLPTSSSDATTFSPTINFYVIFRDSDYQSTTPWQPGSDLNWVQTLFLNPGGPAPFVNSAPGKAILTSLGLNVTGVYQDLGYATAEHPTPAGP